LHSVYVLIEVREHCLRSSAIKAAPVGALLLLCLLWSLASLRPDLLPSSASETNSSPLLNQASILALFAIVAAATAFVQRANWPRGRTLLEAGLVGAGLLALPALLVELAKGHIDDSTRVALFSLVPIGAVVMEPYLGSPLQSPQRGGLAASLVAVAGTLLIFPLELPGSSAQAIAFCGVIAAVASIAAANCTAVKIARSQTNLSGFATIAAGSAAILLAIAALSIERSARPVAHIDAWAIPDLLGLALLFWLMPRMSAVRMTSRFLIAPLMANLIALAFLRPGVQLRGWLGLLLMALASCWLLFAPEDEPDKTGSPLAIT
jgi:drug/metabolite transporter (DMT)-like permease